MIIIVTVIWIIASIGARHECCHLDENCPDDWRSFILFYWISVLSDVVTTWLIWTIKLPQVPFIIISSIYNMCRIGFGVALVYGHLESGDLFNTFEWLIISPPVMIAITFIKLAYLAYIT